MLPIGLNHMTMPHASVATLLDVAANLGCIGVEIRTDLGHPLFDGATATAFADAAARKGQRILGLAEAKAFNENTADKLKTIEALVTTAAACGAEAVALIPAVSDQEVDGVTQRAALRAALTLLQPILQEHHMVGLIEPLGFATSSVRFKEDVVAVLDDLQRPACFAIIHDTFHHHLAGGGAVYADLTAVVHLSGVIDPAPPTAQMTDAHRVLIDQNDRLGSIGQLRALTRAGYRGPASFEAFAPDVHNMNEPTAALAGSIAFIASQLAETAAGVA